MREESGRWFARYAGPHAPRRRLYCFPYAGGGADVFRDWQGRLPDGTEVIGLRLPGREQRFREAVLADWPEAMAALTRAFREEANGTYAFFGHSLGARLAYELTVRLHAEGYPPPSVLFVSACRAPTARPRKPRMYDLPYADLRDRLREMDGVPHEVLADDRLMRLIEPMLRADLKLAETWQPTPGRIPVPITAFCGARDDIDPHEDMLGWRDHTSAAFDIRTFPAGHFFINDQREAVAQAVAEEMTRYG